MTYGPFTKAAMTAALVLAGTILTPAAANAVLATYVVQGGTLWAVDRVAGVYTRAARSEGWGTPTSIAYRGTSPWIHIITNGSIWRVATLDGSRTLMSGNVDWSGPTQMDWNVSTGKLYVVQADRLVRMNDADNSGAWTTLGGPIWTNTTSMASFGNFLYIISNSRLYRVNPNTGSRTALSGPIWTGPTRMTKQFWGTFGSLYVVQAGALHEVDPNDGSFEVIGELGWWTATTSMSCNGGGASSNFHIIDSNYFLRVDSNGDYFHTGMGAVWGGPTVSAGTECFY
jgi:hypothetical protein